MTAADDGVRRIDRSDFTVRVLRQLQEAAPEPVSGEQLGRGIGISRTAIWKHIETLRDEGFNIPARQNRGYSLFSVPDDLHPLTLAASVSHLPFGRSLYFFERTGSTNTEAKVLAARGAEHGTLVLAEEQREGRGRRGRSWYSPAGRGLWFSLVLRPELPLAAASQMTITAAVALRRTLEEIVTKPPELKWPNDILIDGRKVCGILMETSADLEQVTFVIAGIGLNVNQRAEDFPGEISGRAASLRCFREGEEAIDRVELLTRILASLARDYRRWEDGNFSEIKSEWEDGCLHVDQRVTIQGVGERWKGLCLGIDDAGALRLDTGDGIIRLFAGDVVRFGGEPRG